MTDNIFVTGGAGFIGSNFCHYLKSKGLENVIILDMFTYAANPDNLQGLDYQVKGVDLAEKNFELANQVNGLALGVMSDDIIAGLMSALTIFIIRIII